MFRKRIFSKKRMLSALLILCMVVSMFTVIPPAISSVEVEAAGSSGGGLFGALGVSTEPTQLAGYDPQAAQKAREIFGASTSTPEYDELYTVEADKTTTVKGHGTGVEGNSTEIPNTPAYSLQNGTHPFDAEEVVRASISFPFSVPSAENRNIVAIEQGVAILYATNAGLYIRTTNPLGEAGFRVGPKRTLCTFDFTGYKDFEIINLLSGVAGDFDGDGFSEIAVVVPVVGQEDIGTPEEPNLVNVITGRQLQIFAQELVGNSYWFDFAGSWEQIAQYDIASRNSLIPNSYALSAGKLLDNDGKDSLVLAEGNWKLKDLTDPETTTAAVPLTESATPAKLHVFLELSLDENDAIVPDFLKELTEISESNDTIMRAGVAIQEISATAVDGRKTVRRGLMVGGTISAQYGTSVIPTYPPVNQTVVTVSDRLFFFTLNDTDSDLTLFDAIDPVTTERTSVTELDSIAFVSEFQCTSVVAEFQQPPHRYGDNRVFFPHRYIEADRTIFFNGRFNEVGRYVLRNENDSISENQTKLVFVGKALRNSPTSDIRNSAYYYGHYVYGVSSGRTEQYKGYYSYSDRAYTYVDLSATELCFFSRAEGESNPAQCKVERTRDPRDTVYLHHSNRFQVDDGDNFFSESQYHRSFERPTVSLVKADVVASTFYRSDTDAIQYIFKGYQVEYSDPNITALLAAPPHFADLFSLDGGDSASFSSTQLDDTVGSGSGSSMSHHFSVGPYISIDTEVNLLGAKIASMEAEVEFKFGGEWTSSRTVTTEYTTTYGTTGGQDTVVLTIIPYDAFYFDVHVPTTDAQGNPTTEISEASYRIPYKPISTTMSLERYNKIAKAYGMDVIGEDIVKHTPGYPETYNYAENDYISTPPRTVGIGNAYTGESITISTEEEDTSAFTFETNFRFGGGPFNVVIGVSGTYGLETGTSTSSIQGVTYSGTMYDLPEGPESENYIFSWQICEKAVGSGNQRFPYVRYRVTDVRCPVKLPQNFRATDTTTESVTLNWDTIDSEVTGYEIFWKSGNYWLSMGSTENDSIVIGGLAPYQEYEFAIRSVNKNASMDRDKYSAMSEAITVKTRAGSGVPTVTVLEKRVYTFLGGSATLGVTATPYKKNDLLFYQWEKQEESGWVGVYNERAAKLNITNCNVNDIGLYRCVVLENIDGEIISTVSDVIEVIYGRVPTQLSLELQPRYSGYNGLARLNETIELLAKIENVSSTNPPTGEIVYTITNVDTSNVETRSTIIMGDNGKEKWTPSATGTYEIVATYSGNHFYNEAKSSKQSILIVDGAIIPDDYFTITATQSTGGAVQPGNTVYQRAGTDRTFDITPYTGYSINRILVDGQAISWTPLDGANGQKFAQYTFSDINKDYTISAEFSGKSDLKIDQTSQRKVYTGKPVSFSLLSGSGAVLPGGFSLSYEQDAQSIAKPTQEGSYDVIVSREEDDGYKEFSVFIPDGLIIMKQPSPAAAPYFTKNLPNAAAAVKGGNLELSVQATASNGTIAYQWFKDNVALTGRNAGASYTISKADAKSVGKYHVVAINTFATEAKTVKSVVCQVSLISPVASKTIVLNPKALTVVQSVSSRIQATMTPKNTTDKITWKSSDTKIATVNSTGLVVGVSAGKATITAQTTSGAKATCAVTVIGEQYVSLCVDSKKAITNGTKTTIDKEGSKPFIRSGRTMIPLRFVSEKMKAKVSYVDDKKPIVIQYANTTVEVVLGSKTMTIIESGKRMKYPMDVAPMKKGGRTYIPIRSIWQALNFNVYYDGITEIIVISNPKPSATVLNQRLEEAEKYMKRR